MAVSYSWDCRTVDTYPTHSDSQDPQNTCNDVIYNVHYKLIGSETVGGITYTDSVIGSINIDVDDLSSFVGLDAVTNSDVKGWVTASLEANEAGTVAAFKKTIKENIVEKQNPTTEVKYIAN
tara:strand:+ start:3577 stop:3942 length:366 start_codon:yes stop_codon:yes gene_type:complete